LRAAYEKFQDDGLVVLAVSVQESNAAVDNFIAQYGLSYTFVLDIDGTTSSSYEIFTTPTTFFIDPGGVITDIRPGVVNRGWIDGQMTAVLG
jgi:peroxiredoxin